MKANIIKKLCLAALFVAFQERSFSFNQRFLLLDIFIAGAMTRTSLIDDKLMSKCCWPLQQFNSTF